MHFPSDSIVEFNLIARLLTVQGCAFALKLIPNKADNRVSESKNFFIIDSLGCIKQFKVYDAIRHPYLNGDHRHGAALKGYRVRVVIVMENWDGGFTGMRTYASIWCIKHNGCYVEKTKWFRRMVRLLFGKEMWKRCWLVCSAKRSFLIHICKYLAK